MRRWLFKKSVEWIKRTNDVELKHELLTEAVKHLFNSIDEHDILRIENGKVLFRDKPLTEPQVQALREEAKALSEMKLWHIISLNVKYQLNKKMFVESNITMDVMWGKLLLYYHDIVRSRIERMLK